MPDFSKMPVYNNNYFMLSALSQFCIIFMCALTKMGDTFMYIAVLCLDSRRDDNFDVHLRVKAQKVANLCI